MHMVPFLSKQIAFIGYDDQSMQLILQYHTGNRKTFCPIKKDDFNMIINSTNGYDYIVKVTKAAAAEPIA